MRFRRLGASGLQVSELSLGSYLTYGRDLDPARARACVLRAFELGVNCFDTADGYAAGEAERTLGRVLGELPREAWLVATKCFFPQSAAPTDRGLSRKHLVESVEGSLRRLGVDHIDLMQCHRFDSDTPLEETVDAMDDLVRQGKVLYWGLGRCEPEQIESVSRVVERRRARPPVAHQTVYNLVNRSIEDGIVEASASHGLGLLVYGALCQGVLTGKYAERRDRPGSRAADPETRQTMWDLNDETIERAPRLSELAEEAGSSAACLALAWCLRRPQVASVIVGATTVEQVEQNVAATELDPSDGLLERADRIFAPRGRRNAAV